MGQPAPAAPVPGRSPSPVTLWLLVGIAAAGLLGLWSSGNAEDALPASVDDAGVGATRGTTERTGDACARGELPPPMPERGRGSAAADHVEIVVLDATTAQPIAATVAAGSRRLVTSAAEGSVRVPLRRGDDARRVRVTAPGYEPVERDVPASVDALTLRLTPLAVCRVEVVAPRGGAVAGAVIEMLSPAKGASSPVSPTALARTNERGEASFALANPVCAAARLGSSYSQTALLGATGRPRTLVLDAGLDGRSLGIRDAATAEPVPDLALQLRRADVPRPYVLHTVTDAAGILAQPVPAGVYAVTLPDGMFSFAAADVDAAREACPLFGSTPFRLFVSLSDAGGRVWLRVVAQRRVPLEVLDAATGAVIDGVHAQLEVLENAPARASGWIESGPPLPVRQDPQHGFVVGLGTRVFENEDVHGRLRIAAPGYRPETVDLVHGPQPLPYVVRLRAAPSRTLRLETPMGEAFVHEVAVFGTSAQGPLSRPLFAGRPAPDGTLPGLSWDGDDWCLRTGPSADSAAIAVVSRDRLRREHRPTVRIPATSSLLVIGGHDDVPLWCAPPGGAPIAGVRTPNGVRFEPLLAGRYTIGPEVVLADAAMRRSLGTAVTVGENEHKTIASSPRWQPGGTVRGRVISRGIATDSLCVIPRLVPASAGSPVMPGEPVFPVGSDDRYELTALPLRPDHCLIVATTPAGQWVPLVTCPPGDTAIVSAATLRVRVVGLPPSRSVTLAVTPVVDGVVYGRSTTRFALRAGTETAIEAIPCAVACVAVHWGGRRVDVPVALRPGETCDVTADLAADGR